MFSLAKMGEEQVAEIKARMWAVTGPAWEVTPVARNMERTTREVRLPPGLWPRTTRP